MGLVRFSLLKQLISNSKSSFQSLKTFSNSATQLNVPSNISYRPRPDFHNNNLHSKIILFVAGSPNSSVIPFLNSCAQQFGKVREVELRRIIRTLRSKKRFARALEVSEWMTSKRPDHPFAADLAVQLDLIGKVHGIDAAEKYFSEVNYHSERVYGALLSCYVREGLVDKSLSLLKKMKAMGLSQNPLAYNNIMSLYCNTGQVEKIPELLFDMEKNGVSPDNVTYRLCIKSFGLRSDFTSMEKVLEKMESQPNILMDWSTYTTMARNYIQGGLREKAIYYLQKAEEKVDNNAVGYNNLITMYATLGDVSQVMRMWGLQKITCKRQINIDYITIIGSMIKLGELEEAERIFQEWELAANLYDFRVPNLLLIGYTQKGLVEKAERVLEGIISKGKTPSPNSWSIISAGYMSSQNMEKGLECMKRALELEPQHRGWLPRPALISSLLNWLGENGDIKEVEEFLNKLSRVVPMDREMYHTLIKAKIRHGNEIDAILQRMKADSIDVDDETNNILSSR